ncbi:hypothetical protein [Pseudomonas aeruginosa]|jgi:hypothetical protein|uniref:hypothetical protein n=1 Tax=Pseudomonas aeruginosa TaxID=287 RepID=UPI001069A8F4|nr:hypothetical protein [Pseudomonas aeruginosa]
MSTHHTPDLAQRTAKLERYLLLSSLLPFWFAVELLMILAGTGNLLFRGLGNTQGLAMLLIGGCMAIAHFLWVRNVRAFLDETPSPAHKRVRHLKVIK